MFHEVHRLEHVKNTKVRRATHSGVYWTQKGGQGAKKRCLRENAAEKIRLDSLDSLHSTCAGSDNTSRAKSSFFGMNTIYDDMEVRTLADITCRLLLSRAETKIVRTDEMKPVRYTSLIKQEKYKSRLSHLHITDCARSMPLQKVSFGTNFVRGIRKRIITKKLNLFSRTTANNLGGILAPFWAESDLLWAPRAHLKPALSLFLRNCFDHT